MIYLVPLRATIIFACATLLTPPLLHRLTHDYRGHYRYVASQDDRAAGQFGYAPFPGFPHVELVEEDSGRPNRDLTALITDESLRELVNRGAYSSLQVRNFTPRPSAVTRNGDEFTVPFALSLRHYPNFVQQGTLNLEGFLTLKSDGSHVTASITEFDDSNVAERLARFYWLHETDDLHFARAIAESQLTHWLTEDPKRMKTLLTEAAGSGGVERRP